MQKKTNEILTDKEKRGCLQSTCQRCRGLWKKQNKEANPAIVSVTSCVRQFILDNTALHTQV